jgi:putative restriction endonuclease
MDLATRDAQLRQAAFDHVSRTAASRGGVLEPGDLARGFDFDGRRVPLINPQRGIFKPREMARLLSVKTVFPRRGGRVWYDDQRDAHRQIYAGDDTVEYAFMGEDPTAADNRWLREAMERQVPVILFPRVLARPLPAHHPRIRGGLAARAATRRTHIGAIVGASAQATVPAAPERRYALREIKQRLHQASFREAVLSAYGSRCAISRLPEPRLLDAAHIVVDADEQMGQPVVTNGLPLSKIHHAAFDEQLIGIDPDFRIHVSDRLLDLHDGPFLEQGLKAMAGRLIRLPRRKEDYPDRERLAFRFEQFRRSA